MGIINQLDTSISNMIAAGEVVLGPESVVKELVENSIDAKSSEITISLVESGLRSIEIQDNGIGMDKIDANLAFSRHATSKIKNAFDLSSIKTLGFRGEALPSIASVSNVVMQTKQRSDEYGIKVELKAGKVINNETTACQNGTRIMVTNLFYNTPARMKYLKDPQTILANISNLVDKFALANPTISFKFVNNDKVLLQTSGNGNYFDIFMQVYGLEVAKLMNNIKDEFDGMNLDIYFSSPICNRSRKNDMTVIVNGRFVRSYLINNAICDAYEKYIPKYRYPICLVNLDIDPLLIDINVHPQKTEIKFSLEKEVVDFVTKTLIKGLEQLMIIPEITEQKYEGVQQTFDEYVLQDKVTDEKPEIPVLKTESKNIDYKEKIKVEFKKEEFHEPVKEEGYKHLPYLEYIGQLSGTYLLFQNDNGLYLVDQHACQERINYEYYLNILKNPAKDSFELLVPYSITLTNQEFIILDKNKELLANYGIELEDVGNNTFFIRKTPLWIKNNAEEVIEKTLYYLIEHNTFDIGLIRNDLAKMIACKASIKANSYVTEMGAYNLLKELDKCENPFNCPHGRPVFVSITLKEIEKMFLRTV